VDALIASMRLIGHQLPSTAKSAYSLSQGRGIALEATYNRRLVYIHVKISPVGGRRLLAILHKAVALAIRTATIITPCQLSAPHKYPLPIKHPPCWVAQFMGFNFYHRSASDSRESPRIHSNNRIRTKYHRVCAGSR